MFKVSVLLKYFPLGFFRSFQTKTQTVERTEGDNSLSNIAGGLD